MAVLTPEQGQAKAHKDTNGGKAGGAVAMQSFPSQAKEHLEPVTDVTFTPGASQVNLGTFEVPAFGYLRSILFLVEATGGAGAATFAADAPWNAITAISLSDVNGQPLFGPYDGYDLYLVHLLGGGVQFDSDPTRSPAYTTPDTATGNFSFLLRLPVEITSRDGLGALANQNTSSTYKLHVEGASKATIYSAGPATTTPAVRVRTYLEAWTQPESGATPPALGTTAYWSKQVVNGSAGQQTWRVQRVGNAIRNLIVVTRDATGARVSTIWPDPVAINLDGKQLVSGLPAKIARHYTQERYALASLPTGVYVLDYTHDLDGKPGNELRDLWLRTTSATRLELQGVAGAAGTVTLMVNDVASFAGAGV